MSDTLSKRAIEILAGNWRDGFTIPTARLYPFQWNWDSGFVSLGHGYYKPEWAIREIGSLFSGQWENGMLPHIIFHSEQEKTYFPNFDFWQAEVNPGAPTKPKTSGITQPAVHGFVLENLLDQHPTDESVRAFVREIYPKLLAYHRFLYTYRDPHREGLFFMYHPWESGRDNSPLWDEALDKIQINPGDIPPYQRRDTQIADASERPTSRQYDQYVYLLQLGKKHQYDRAGIAAESPFLIQDSMMNAILIKSNNSLIRIGKQLGLDTAEVEEWQQQSIPAFRNKLWNDSLGIYTGYDMRAGKQLAMKEIGGFIPMLAEIPTANQATRMNDYLKNLHQRGYYLCPSFDVDHPLFDSKRYWRGPIWPQMNWMLHHGLLAYGFRDTADLVKNDLISLVNQLGFHEYFEPQKSLAAGLKTGYGGDNFSWTASSIISLMH
jgi:hypothetical protein